MYGVKSKYVICIALIIFSAIAVAFDVPELHSRITDQAQMFSPQLIAKLENKLADFENTTSVQIAILTINSLQGENLEAAAIKTANTWKLGDKHLHNGLLIFIAKQDRSIRVEVGAGLEGVITDAIAGRIIDNIIRPNFKAGNFDNGIEQALEALQKQISSSNAGNSAKSTNNNSQFAKLGDYSQFEIMLRIAIYLSLLAIMYKLGKANQIKTKALFDQYSGNKSDLVYDPESIVIKQLLKDNPALAAGLKKSNQNIKTLIWSNQILLPVLFIDICFRNLEFFMLIFLLAYFAYLIGKRVFLNNYFLEKEKHPLSETHNTWLRTQYFGSHNNVFWGNGSKSGSSFSGGGGFFRGGGSSGKW